MPQAKKTTAKKTTTTKKVEPVTENVASIEQIQEIEQKFIPLEQKTAKPKKPEWEIKDRVYYLNRNKKPIVMTLPTKHTQKRPLLWFDEDLGYERELRYATNQQSVFVDEQKGEATLGRVIFRDGTLFVPKRQQNLQKLLSLYHPLKGHLYEELDTVKDAESQLDRLDIEFDAMALAKQLDIDDLEAILRAEFGSKVKDLSTKELRRDAMLFARKNPILFIQLANDENVKLRNFGIKCVEAGYLKLSQDQRYFLGGQENRKLFTIPFDENPYSALAAWFKTDEGTEVYLNLQKKII